MFGPRIEEDRVRWQASDVINEAIAAFWEAWPGIRPFVETEIESGQYGEGTALLTELTELIEPNLEWELMPGHTAANALCLSSAADPRLRLLTELWCAEAPVADRTWEYHPARISVGSEVIELAGTEIDPAGATVGINPDPFGEMLNLTIGHPAFGGLDETLQLQAAFRFLDDLLGEDSTERSVGSVEVYPEAVSWGIPLVELTQSIELLTESATGKQWDTIEQHDTELGQSELVINRAIKRLDHLELAVLMTVSVEIPNRKDVSLADTVEDYFAAILDKDGVIVARETYDTFVVIYAYGLGSKIPELIKLSQRHGPAVYNVITEADPAWDAYDEMR